jgi:hypothetical protein
MLLSASARPSGRRRGAGGGYRLLVESGGAVRDWDSDPLNRIRIGFADSDTHDFVAESIVNRYAEGRKMEAPKTGGGVTKASLVRQGD